MKKLFVALSIVLMIFGLCACQPIVSIGGGNNNDGDEDKDQYMINPFEIEQINVEAVDVGTIQGTYLASDNTTGYFGIYNYYLVSLKGDGTTSITPVDGYIVALSDGFTTGTWSEEYGVISLSSGFGTYTGSKEELVNTKTGEITGVAVVKNSVDYIKLRKISNSYLDETLHTSKKLSGLYARSNDFGEVSAYRFLEDGTYYQYFYSDYEGRNVASKGTYSFSLNGTQIRLGNSYIDDGYNIALAGDTLFLDGSQYTRVLR